DADALLGELAPERMAGLGGARRRARQGRPDDSKCDPSASDHPAPNDVRVALRRYSTDSDRRNSVVPDQDNSPPVAEMAPRRLPAQVRHAIALILPRIAGSRPDP